MCGLGEGPGTRGTLRSRTDRAGHFCLCRLRRTRGLPPRGRRPAFVATQLHRGSPKRRGLRGSCASRGPSAERGAASRPSAPRAARSRAIGVRPGDARRGIRARLAPHPMTGFESNPSALPDYALTGSEPEVATLPLLCLLLRSSWLMREGGGQIGAVGVLHRRVRPAAVAVRVGLGGDAPSGSVGQAGSVDRDRCS